MKVNSLLAELRDSSATGSSFSPHVCWFIATAGSLFWLKLGRLPHREAFLMACSFLLSESIPDDNRLGPYSCQIWSITMKGSKRTLIRVGHCSLPDLYGKKQYGESQEK